MKWSQRDAHPCTRRAHARLAAELTLMRKAGRGHEWVEYAAVCAKVVHVEMSLQGSGLSIEAHGWVTQYMQKVVVLPSELLISS